MRLLKETPFGMDVKPNRNPKVVFRLELRDKNLRCLIYLHNYNDFCFCELNQPGFLIYYLCNGKNSLIDISWKLSFQYKKEKKICEKMVKDFIDLLIRERLLIIKAEESEDSNLELLDEEKEILLRTQNFSKPILKIFKSGLLDPNKLERPLIPLIVYFEITKRCNLECRHCYVDSTATDLLTGEVKKIIEQLVLHKVLRLCILGGEPFVREDCCEIIEFAKERGLKLVIITNGTMLDRDKLLRLKNAEIDGLAFSLDGSSPQEHDYIRGKGSFQAVIEKIKIAVEVGIPVEISFTLNRINFKNFKNFYKLCLDLGILRATTSFYRRLGIHNADLSLSPIAWWYFFIKSRSTSLRNKKIPIIIPSVCSAGHSICKIDPQGNLSPCPSFDISFGNVLKEDLADIWNNGKFSEFLNIDNLKLPCRLCIFRKRCRGFCRAETLRFTGDLFAPHPYNCIMNRIYSKIKIFSKR